MNETVENRGLVPELRFPAFQSGWREFRVDQIGRVVTGRTPPTSDRTLYGGDYLFVTPTDMDGHRFVMSTRNTLTTAGVLCAPSVRAGSTCVVCIASIGKIAQAAQECVTNQQINSVEPFAQFDDTFVYYALRMLVPKLKQVAGQQTMQILNKSEFSAMRTLVPEKAEQRKIAECLGSLDELIAAEADKLEALKRHKKGLLQQLFPAEGETIPRLRFKEFRESGEWKEESLSDLGAIIQGLTYSPSDVRDCGLLVLRSSNIKNGKIAFDDCVYVDPHVKGANLSKPNDILICVRNGSAALIGKNALLPTGLPLCTHGAFMSVYRSPSANFVYQLFQTLGYQRQVAADLGATINSINGSQFVKYKFFVPALPEQQRVAGFLHSVDERTEAVAKKLELLKKHKAALMQQLFPSLEELDTVTS